MGDRASVSFTDANGEESIAFFSHWDGPSLFDDARRYAKELCEEIYAESLKPTPGIAWPLDRLEPQTTMVDFIRWLFAGRPIGDRIKSNYYFGTDGDDGDNSDNGHLALNLNEIYDDVKSSHERIEAMKSALATATTATPAAATVTTTTKKAAKKTAAEWKASKEMAAKITGYGSTSPIWGKTDVQVFTEIQARLADLRDETGLYFGGLAEAIEYIEELQKREAFKRLAATL